MHAHAATDLPQPLAKTYPPQKPKPKQVIFVSNNTIRRRRDNGKGTYKIVQIVVVYSHVLFTPGCQSLSTTNRLDSKIQGLVSNLACLRSQR